MSAIEIREFDAASASRSEWTAYHRLRRCREAEDHPARAPAGDAEFEREAVAAHPLLVQRRFVALLDGEFAGNLVAHRRREGTPDAASFAGYVTVTGGVIERFRRRGVATALLGSLHADMLARDAHTANFVAWEPAAHAMLHKIGAVEKLRDLESHLDLRECRRDDLARLAAAAPPGLHCEIHAPRAPLERLGALMAPLSALVDQAPRGRFEGPFQRYEIDTYRGRYARMDQDGGEHLLVLLVNDRGAPMAVSEAMWLPIVPTQLGQVFTGVDPRWRGLGAAKAVKARLVLLALERLPQATTLLTYNAATNAAMLAVNLRLGYRVLRERVVYQLGRTALEDHLRSRLPSA